VQHCLVGSEMCIRDRPNTRLDSAPYGGAGNSGVGREGPAFAMEEMTEWQTTYHSVAQ
jgi:acyl-CoA reductase-like NAD-dependent aldehyde dehydrogenase